MEQLNCSCNREKVKKALIYIGKEELNDIIIKDKKAELKCQFCGKKYIFTQEQLIEILNEM